PITYSHTFKIALAYLQVGRTSKEGARCVALFYFDFVGASPSPDIPSVGNFLGAGPRKFRYCSASLSITSYSDN
ncbi:MAG: hypothetical protein IJ492_05410, partial [Clostridia bacterium]|nr:hypothetical protein [Clostridia bacterium]